MKIYVNKGNYGWQTKATNNDEKMYIDVGFRKGQEPNQSFCQIKINEGFFSMYKTKTGLAKPKLVILDYEEIIKSKEEYEERQSIMEENEYEIKDNSELPF